MALHHRQNVDNMRSAYGSRNDSGFSHKSVGSSARSYGSDSVGSYATAPTEYSSGQSKRPVHVHYNNYDSRTDALTQRFFADKQPEASPRASVATYASTEDGNAEEDFDEETLPVYDASDYDTSAGDPNVLPATPADFSELFPSKRRFLIHHDDSTLDGNMNLRVDARVYCGSRKCDMTLFHLRMHDIGNREFSLRRYCRDSGREVCHSARKQLTAAASKRPTFQRSLSNALSSMRPKSESRAPTLDSLKRSDSGYGSMHSTDLNDIDRPRSAGQGASVQPQPSNDTIKLEFSNYAQIDVKRTGAKGHKRYDYEYWGVSYSWRRVVRKQEGNKTVSYHLTKAGSDKVLAYIVPVAVGRSEAEKEVNRGGWVPPCSVWLSDEKLVHGQKDAADAVIASGLMALVDDSIRMHFKVHSSGSIGLEYVGPKRFLNELFRRQSSESSQHSRPSSSWKRDTDSHTSSRVRPATSRQTSDERAY